MSTAPMYPVVIEELEGSPHIPGRKNFIPPTNTYDDYRQMKPYSNNQQTTEYSKTEMKPIIKEHHHTTKPILVNKQTEVVQPVVIREPKPYKKGKNIKLGKKPCMWRCKYCNQVVPAEVQYKTSAKTCFGSCGLGALTCCLCCCAPFCMDSCKTAHYYCPICGKEMH